MTTAVLTPSFANGDPMSTGTQTTCNEPAVTVAPPHDVESPPHVEAYLTEYYDSLTDENLNIGRFLADAARPRGTAARPARALDMGCGPTLLYWALFVDGYDEYHGVDASEDNVASLRRDIAAGITGRMHARYRSVCEHLFGGIAGGPEARIKALCQRVLSVQIGDAAGSWAFPDGSMDLVTMIFALEVLASTEQLRHALGEARRVLRPGGRLVACTLCETTSWRVGDFVGSCLHLTRGSLAAELASAGFEEVSVERCAATTAVARQQGYTWMLFAAATRTSHGAGAQI